MTVELPNHLDDVLQAGFVTCHSTSGQGIQKLVAERKESLTARLILMLCSIVRDT